MDFNQYKAQGEKFVVERANIDTNKQRWTIFDALGQNNFLDMYMYMGKTLADYGCLVISAKKGEYDSENFRTIEHL